MQSELVYGVVPGIAIETTAVYTPDPPGRMVTNEEIHELLLGSEWQIKMKDAGTDPEHVHRTHGFRARYWTSFPPAHNAQFGSHDLMAGAGRLALTQSPGPIDLVVAVSTTPSRYTTSMAALVAGELGLSCPIFDIKAGCTSWIYALVVAARTVPLGRVLIVGAEILSALVAPGSPLLYAAADGGAALILSCGRSGPSALPGDLECAVLGGNGSLNRLAGVPCPIPGSAPEDYRFQQDPEIERYTLPLWQSVSKRLLAMCGGPPDYVIPHQVNRRAIDVVRAALGMAEDRVVQVVDRTANCGSVSIVFALHALRERMQHESVKGQRWMLVAVGGGLTYGGAVFRI